MGIYNRDNINYGGFLQAAIANKIHNAERQAEQEKAIGELWGDTIAKAGETIGRGAFYSYGGDSKTGSDTSIAEDKAELAKLEDIQKTYNEQVAQRKKFDEIFNNPNYDTQAAQSRIASNEMSGYNPTAQYMSQGASNFMENYKPFYTRNYIPTQDGVWYDLEEQERMKREAAELMNGYNPYYYTINGYYRRGR